MSKKSKSIPKLNTDTDLFTAFGGKRSKPTDFTAELAANLNGQNLSKILQEKADPKRPPLTRREIIKSYPPPQDELDLHRLTREEAEQKTSEFIRISTSLKLRTVRVITGKGLHSEGPAVLPEVIATKLKELKSHHQIFDFTWDKKELHKSGSVIVYLV